MKKRRILILSFDFPPKLGGVATCAIKLTEALAARADLEVRVIAPRYPGYQAFDQTLPFQVVRVRRSLNPKLALFHFVIAAALETLRWRPAALVGMLWFPDALAAFLLRCLLPFSAPYYLFAHGVEVMESEATAWKRLRKRLSLLKKAVFRGSSGVFAVSSFTKKLVERECSLPDGRVHVVNNGVSCREFYPLRPGSKLADRYGTHGRFVFLSITRLHKYKGVDQAIFAIEQVREEFPEALYLIGGQGPDRARLEQLVAERSLGEHVKFIGTVEQQELLALYNLADCFVLLSREDRNAPNVEGFGIVFLEAAACGKPSIAGNSGGVADAVDHGKSGWLVDPLNTNEIAEHMRKLLREPELGKALGEQGRLRAQEQFTWDRAGEKVLEGIVGS